MTATDVFTSNLDALEEVLRVRLTGDTIGERFTSLARLITSKAGDQATMSTLASHARSVRKRMRRKPKFGPGGVVDYSTPLADHLYACAVSGFANSTVADVAKLQHWIPVTYLRAFNDSSVGTARRAVKIRRTDYRAGGNSKATNVFSNGKELCHKPKSGGAAFDSEVEVFFSEVEGHYTNAAQIFPHLTSFANKRAGVRIAGYVRENIGTGKVVDTLGMFVIQSVRSTSAVPQKREMTIAGVLNAVVASLETLGPIDAHLVSLPGRGNFPPLVFSPVTDISSPARVVYGDCGIHHFPLSPNVALMVADKGMNFDPSLTVGDYAVMVSEFNHSLVSAARIRGGVLYGANSVSLAKWFPLNRPVPARRLPNGGDHLAA